VASPTVNFLIFRADWLSAKSSVRNSFQGCDAKAALAAARAAIADRIYAASTPIRKAHQ
jgi:hypothetical protein